MVLINVQELAEATVTRERGLEAAEKLLSLSSQGPIEIRLDGAELLSTSFLDEIVLRLSAAGQLDRVAFVSHKQSTIEKLERIASIRSATVRVRSGDAAHATPLMPRRAETRATFAPRKASAG